LLLYQRREDTNKDKKTSWVWEHFTTKPTGETYGRNGSIISDSYVVCAHQPCEWRVLDSKRKQSTSSMKRHLGKTCFFRTLKNVS
jgi:hypothetical protein